MTAGTHAYVACNGWDSTELGGKRYCTERIEEGSTKAEARRIARRRGWLTGVHSGGQPSTRKLPGWFDFCPAHKPAPAEGEKR